MKRSKNYFIKPEYLSNVKNITLEKDNQVYWTEKRIYAASFYQYDVYLTAQKIAKKHQLSSIIDIGCGPATKLLKLLRPVAKRLVGVDQESIINICKGRNVDVEFYADNIEDPTLDLAGLELENRFSLIVCADVIEHMTDPDLLLRYIHKVAQDRAWLIISTPERDVLRGNDCVVSPNHAHIREWNREEFAEYLADRGFEIVEHFLAPDQKIRLDREYIRLLIRMWQRRQKLKTNQVAICRLRKKA